MAKLQKPMGRKRAGWTRQNVQKLRRADALAERADGLLQNAMTGLGVPGVDQAMATQRLTVHYTPQQARSEYRGSWAARREIDRPARDLVREGFEFEDLPPWVDQAAVWAYLDDVGSELTGADVPEDRGVLAALSRLYGEGNKLGGAALFMNIDDGLPPWEPLDLTRVRSLVSLELLERDELTPLRMSMGTSVRVDHYLIGSNRTTIGPGALVHASRLIISKGMRLSPSEEWITGWGASALELLQVERTTMHAAVQEAGSLLHKLVTDVAFFAELNEILCSKDSEERAALDDRMALIATARSQHKLIPMDGGREGGENERGRRTDQFTSIARPVDGVQKVLTAISEHWAGGSGQTPAIALGKIAPGLNNGEQASAWQSWGGHVAGEQEYWLKPRLDQVLDVCFAAQDGPTGGQIPETWGYKFGALWKPSESEIEDVRSKRTATDLAMQGAGWITAEQCADQRLVKGSTGELSLDVINPPAQPAGAVVAQPVADQGPSVDAGLAALVMEVIGKLRTGELTIDLAMLVLSTAAPGIDPFSIREQLVMAFPQPDTAEVEQDADEEPDPVETALAQIPTDLATSTEIAAMLTERFGRSVTPHGVTAMATAGRLKKWPSHDQRGSFSRAAALRLWAEIYGVLPPEAPPEDAAEVEPAEEPASEAEPEQPDDVADKLEQRGEAWVVLSEAGEVLAEYTGPDAEEQARERLRQIEAAKAAKGDEP